MRQEPAEPERGRIVELAGLDHVQAVGDGMQRDGAVAGMAQPEGVDRVGDDQVERPPCCRVERTQGLRRVVGLGMVERFQHQLATAALAGRRSQRTPPVEYAGNEAVIVQSQPGAARLDVQAGPDMRSIRPVATWRQARPAAQLVAVGGEQQGPLGGGATKENQRAHRERSCRAAMRDMVKRPGQPHI